MSDPQAPVRSPLPTELHAATRSEHATLNRNILTRLPLCLPHATSTPALFAQGMAVIGQVYYGFEEAWDTLLSGDSLSKDQRALLTQLNIPQLRRTRRLDQSLGRLRSDSANVQFATLQAATAHFREDIARSILANPHLIMAYTWTMYLALFNGGRYIAKQLLGAGSLFWSDADRAATVNESLSFWFFGDDEGYDGEDLKILFKDRFNNAAESLNDQQRDEVIAEAKKIFQILADMVDFLDHFTQTNETQPISRKTSNSSGVGEVQHDSSAFGYLRYLTPSPVASIWRSLMNKIPMSQTLSNALLRRDIEQKN